MWKNGCKIEWKDLTKRLYWLAMPNHKQLVAGHAEGSWGRSCYSARLPGKYQHFKMSSQFVWKRHVRSTELVVNEDETLHEAQKRNKNSKEAKLKMLKYCEFWHFKSVFYLYHLSLSIFPSKCPHPRLGHPASGSKHFLPLPPRPCDGRRRGGRGTNRGSQLSFVRQLHLHLLQHIEDTKRCILVIVQHAQKLQKIRVARPEIKKSEW